MLVVPIWEVNRVLARHPARRFVEVFIDFLLAVSAHPGPPSSPVLSPWNRRLLVCQSLVRRLADVNGTHTYSWAPYVRIRIQIAAAHAFGENRSRPRLATGAALIAVNT
jgi:hypothetical protein